MQVCNIKRYIPADDKPLSTRYIILNSHNLDRFVNWLKIQLLALYRVLQPHDQNTNAVQPIGNHNIVRFSIQGLHIGSNHLGVYPRERTLIGSETYTSCTDMHLNTLKSNRKPLALRMLFLRANVDYSSHTNIRRVAKLPPEWISDTRSLNYIYVNYKYTDVDPLLNHPSGHSMVMTQFMSHPRYPQMFGLSPGGAPELVNQGS